MAISPLSLSRKHILGGIYADSAPFTENVPVYLHGEENELLGHADQALGHYADAITFHLAEDVCKKLASGQYSYEFDADRSAETGKIVIHSIYLKPRQNYKKP